MVSGMMLAPDDPRLTAIALRKELIAAGHSDRSLAVGLRAGAYERPRTGAYVDGPTWRAMTKEQKYAVRARAAYLQRRTSLWLSHVSAVALTDGPLWGLGLAHVHVTRDDQRSGRREAGIQQHSGRLRDGDVIEEHGTRLSSPIRASLEVATVGDLAPALAVANFYLHRGDFTLEDLAARYDTEMDRWPRSLHTRLVLQLADPRIESVGESRVAHFLWRAGLRAPEVQLEILDNGHLVARLDFADPDRGFWIEFGGREKYGKYLRPGESVADAVLREKRREDRVRELTGWACFRIVWADLADPERLAVRLRTFIAAVAQRRTAS